MSDTTRTDHAAAIREVYRQYMNDPRKGPYDEDAFFDAVSPLFDAMTAKLADAEARAERLNATILAYRANVEGVLSQYDPDFVWEVVSGAEEGLIDGDLDTPEAQP